MAKIKPKTAEFFAVSLGGERTAIKTDFGVEIKHGGNDYRVGVDNNGKLYLRSQRGRLVLRPEVSNSISIDSE